MSQYRLIELTEAIGDVSEALSWYEGEQAGLGERFFDEYYASLDILKINPFVYQVDFNEYRKFNLDRFPYLVFYKIEEMNVIIVGVFHGAQDPKRMVEKLKGRA